MSNIDYPKEFLDVYEVLYKGAKKYGENSWLEGRDFNPAKNQASIIGHAVDGYRGQIADKETGLHPDLHAACRLLMRYTLWCRKQKT